MKQDTEKTPRVEYRAWWNMIKRCTDPTHPAWNRYGGRGIVVAPGWKTSFKAFLDHIGLRPTLGLSLDRINNNGNYEPGNVRWATRKQQALNKRPCPDKTFVVGGEEWTSRRVSEMVGICRTAALQRLREGDTLARLLRPRDPRGSSKRKVHDLA